MKKLDVEVVATTGWMSIEQGPFYETGVHGDWVEVGNILSSGQYLYDKDVRIVLDPEDNGRVRLDTTVIDPTAPPINLMRSVERLSSTLEDKGYIIC